MSQPDLAKLVGSLVPLRKWLFGTALGGVSEPDVWFFCRLLQVCRRWRLFGLEQLEHLVLGREHNLVGHGNEARYRRWPKRVDPETINFNTTDERAWHLFFRLAEWRDRRIVGLAEVPSGKFVCRACPQALAIYVGSFFSSRNSPSPGADFSYSLRPNHKITANCILQVIKNEQGGLVRRYSMSITSPIEEDQIYASHWIVLEHRDLARCTERYPAARCHFDLDAAAKEDLDALIDFTPPKQRQRPPNLLWRHADWHLVPTNFVAF